jgi:lipopolysaccharide export system permease protein
MKGLFGRLDRYVAGIYLSSWLVSAVFFLGLFSVVSFFSHVEELLDHAGGSDEGLALIGTYYLYQAPAIFVQVAPFVMLMAALFTVMRLQRHNELMAMLMTGRSARRVLLPVLALTVAFIGLLVWVQEGLAPRFSLERERLKARIVEGTEDWVIPKLTMKDARGNLFTARNYHAGTGVIEVLDISGRDERGRNISVSGRDATHDPEAEGWRLFEGVIETRTFVPEETLVSEPCPLFRTDLRPENLLGTRMQPFDLSWSDVLERSERYPQAPNYRMLRHYHVTYPLSVLLLVTLGLPFVLKRQPRSNMLGLGISILMCLVFLIGDATMRDLGARGFLSPVLAAWLPVIVAGSLSVVLFDSMET